MKNALPVEKIEVLSMDNLIHWSELEWRQEDGSFKVQKKKIIYAEELHEALHLDLSHRARDIKRWEKSGFIGCDWQKTNFSPSMAKIPSKVGRPIYSVCLRIEFAKKICMSVNTPVADAVRDYLIRETAAFWEAAKRQALAKAENPAINLSEAVQRIISSAVDAAVKQAVEENNEKNRAASREMFVALEDLREEKVSARNKDNLRAHINNIARKYCYDGNIDYHTFFNKCYASFKLRHKSTNWYWDFCKCSNKIEFIANNLPKKYLEEFHSIVYSYILERK